MGWMAWTGFTILICLAWLALDIIAIAAWHLLRRRR